MQHIVFLISILTVMSAMGSFGLFGFLAFTRKDIIAMKYLKCVFFSIVIFAMEALLFYFIANGYSGSRDCSGFILVTRLCYSVSLLSLGVLMTAAPEFYIVSFKEAKVNINIFKYYTKTFAR